MTYRDDREALRERVQELEAEVDRLKKAQGVPSGQSRLLGGPRRIRFERSIDHEIGEDALEDIVRFLREHYKNEGRIERLGGTLTWRFGHYRADITSKHGQTKIVLEMDRTGVVAGVASGVGLAGFLGAGATVGVLHDTGSPMWLFFPIVAGLVTGAWAGLRGLSRRSAARNQLDMAKVVDALEEIARHAAPPTRARVATGGEAKEAEEPEEAEQEEAVEEASEGRSG